MFHGIEHGPHLQLALRREPLGGLGNGVAKNYTIAAAAHHQKTIAQRPYPIEPRPDS
ncbi:hypothetical protein GCM10022407_14140 [Hymenobacter antarcticus]|uniref:Uncharacterized protein n=1 Tax=Hymenobacter antarcticus TaxID=486270 RepID=A0ABP7PQ69_9BACT